MILAKSTTPSAEPVTTASLERSDLERLLVIYRPYLRMVAQRSVPESLQARLDHSDLVQETLIRGFANLSQFTGSSEAEFRGWILQILKHQLVTLVRYHSATKRDLRRESMVPQSLVAVDPTPSESCRQLEERERINQLLNQLSPTQKQIVLWRNDGASFVEIGNRLGCTHDAARMAWGRAVRRIITQSVKPK